MDQPVSVVTGGAGFLGSHLCDRLLSAGHKVICVDNFLTGSEENIAHLAYEPDFKFVLCDVTKVFPVYSQHINYIFHFASPASPVDYFKFPIQTLRVGAFGTYMMLWMAKERNARFLLASTSEVYGDPQIHPQPESYWGNVNPVGVRSVYDEAKRFAEAMTTAYQRHRGVDTRIVRIFNTYGERMRLADGRAIPAFMSQVLRGEDVTVFGDGTQTRSVCYVSDLIEGIFKLMMSNHKTPMNIGNPQEITVQQLAEEIIVLTGGHSKIVHTPLPEDDPKVRQPDITLARQVLDWEPVVTRAEGLRRTLAYFKRKLLQ